MRILILSPTPTYPAASPERAWLKAFGQALKNDGHALAFILCTDEEVDHEALEDMEQFWDNFLYLKANSDPGKSDKARISEAVKMLAPPDLDLVILNHIYLYPDYDHIPPCALKIAIPNLHESVSGSDLLVHTQKGWFEALTPYAQRDAFAKSDILIAHSEVESKDLDLASNCPVITMPLLTPEREKAANEDGRALCLDDFYRAITNKRKRILFITDRQFWDVRNAISSVLVPFFRYFQKHFNLTVYYLGSFSKDDWDKVWELGLYTFVKSANIPTDYHTEHSLDENEAAKKAFLDFLQTTPHFDIFIFNFITISYLADIIPYKAARILDTQDIMAVRRYSMEQHLTYDMPLARESRIYDKFDAVTFIENSERDFASTAAEKTISVYCPASYMAEPPAFPEKGIHFGFVGSQWILNTEAIEWFIEQVWPFQDRADAYLHIFGGVCKCLGTVPDNVILHGVVQSYSAMFAKCNVILNPTLRGSGFPTKSLQALAHGRPLLATEKGARGLMKHGSNGIYVAKNRAEHIEGLLRFSHDEGMRSEYSRQALAYARSNFTEKPSYQDLIGLIDNY